MAINQKKAIMWGGLTLLGAYAVYEYLQKKKIADAAAAAAAAQSDTQPFSNTAIQTVTSLPGGSTSSGQVQNSMPLAIVPAIDPAIVSLVQNWAIADGRPPVLAMMNAMISDEYNEMAMIIQGWDSTPPGQAYQPTPDATKFWNDLRDKYDPTHKSW